MDYYYHKILGVPENASKEQIRKAYLRKAKKLHPDINKSPDAHQRFLEVRVAYEVLINPTYRSFRGRTTNHAYTTSTAASSASSGSHARNSSRHTDYRRYTSFYNSYNDKHSETINYYHNSPIFNKKIINSLKGVSIFTLCVALSIFLDYFLPYRHFLGQVVGFNGHNIYVENVSHEKFKDNRKKLDISPGINVFSKIKKGDKIEVESTPLYSFDRRVRVSHEGRHAVITPEYSIYDYFIIFPLTLFSISLIGIILSKYELFAVRFGVANGMVLILMGIFFLIA